MIPAQVFQAAGLRFHACQQRVNIGNLLRMQFLPHLIQQFDENASQHCCVLAGPMVVKGSHLECLCHAVQPVTFHVREQDFGHFHGINGGELPLNAKAFTALVDKCHVKARIMCYQWQIPGKRQKSRQGFRQIRCILHSLIRNTGELRDIFRNRLMRVHIGLEFLQNLAIAHLNRRNFRDFLMLRL